MNTHCSKDVLESALAGNLPADAEARLQQHLESCIECSAALEQLAGGTEWCREAAALLARDELDAGVRAREEWSDVDFTVEHLEPSDEPSVLGRLGGYDVLEVIGRGGMSVVLKGYDRDLKRCVAIKVLAPYLAQSSLAKKRFAREAQAAAAVVHPHVLAIHQVQASGRLPFLVMPLVSGETLAARLAAQGTLELKETLRIGMQAAAGLAAAHEQGLVHRDVKPANILLEKGVERAVLTDFGLARAADDVALTRWGIIAGTPEYMSPEQARGEPLDGRSDLFSLGCVLYQMASGVSPFRADSVVATMRRLVDDPPQAIASLNPELPPWFIAIVDRLLQKDPAKRLGSAREVSELLEGCLAHVQQPASVPLPAALRHHTNRRSLRFHLSRKGVLAMISVAAMALLAIVLCQPSPPSGNDAAPVAATGPDDQTGQRKAVSPGHSAADKFFSDLSTLSEQLQRRDESISQISYQGTVRYLDKLDTVRREGETNEEFIKRHTSLPPRFSSVAPFRIAVVRDYPAGIGHVKLGDINQSVPKYMEYYFHEDTVTQLMGVEPGRCQATISGDFPPELREPSETLPRMDLFALRPVRDHPLNMTIQAAATTMGRPDAGGRPLFQLERRFGSGTADGWMVTFLHQEPDGDQRKDILWFRIFLESREAESVVTRVDQLSVIGDSDSMPVTTALLEDYRKVGDVHLPYRIRMFRFGNDFLLGSELTIDDVRVNDAVKVPDRLQIPPGTKVRDTNNGKEYRADNATFSPEDQQSLAAALRQFNASTAAVRRELFSPPIPDLTVERLREGFVQSAQLYRRVGKEQVADALQRIAESGRLPDDATGGLIASGVHARDDNGETVSRQVVPALTLPDDSVASGYSLIVLRPLELMYRKDGPVSKDYGDLFDGEAQSVSASTTMPGPGWGEPVGGVRIRASTVKQQWPADEAVELTLDLNNASGGQFGMARIPYCEVEIDDVWYIPAVTERLVAGSHLVGQGVHERVTVVRLTRNEWVLKSAVKADIKADDRAYFRELLLASADAENQLLLMPGRHTIRVACEVDGRAKLPVSQPVEIEVVAAEQETGATETTGESPGILVKVLLNVDTHSHELMNRNLGFDGISLMGTGIHGTIDGKESDNLVAVLAHNCRLETFAEGESAGRKYWHATFFVPQGPTSDGSNRSLSQERLDAMQAEGVQFALDHTRDQPAEVPDRRNTQEETIMPTRLNYFTTGHSITLACSADGKLIAVANGNPTRILQVGGTSRVKGHWKPTADILDGEKGQLVTSLRLTTAEEEAVLSETEWITHVEATALAFSPAEDLVAVGTNIGQVKLYHARTGELVRSLDDEPAKLADPKAPANWRPLRRAIGSVASLAFSSDGSLLAVCGGSFDDFPGVLDGVTRFTRKITAPGRVKLFDVRTGMLQHDLVGHSHANTVAFSPDGNLLASSGSWLSPGGNEFGAGVILWNPQTGERIRAITNEANGGTHAVAFSPNSKMIAFGATLFDHENATSFTAVRMAYALSGAVTWAAKLADGATPAGFSPDGESVLVRCQQSIRFLNAETGAVEHEVKAADLSTDGRWDDIAVAPRAGRLIIGSADEAEGNVALWDFAAPAAAATSESRPNGTTDAQ